MEAIQGAGAFVFGFWFLRIISHPSYLKSKLPNIIFGNVELLPNFKIKLKNQIIHIHHWISLLSILSMLILVTPSFASLILVKSFCLGGIVQGLGYKDRFSIVSSI